MTNSESKEAQLQPSVHRDQKSDSQISSHSTGSLSARFQIGMLDLFLFTAIACGLAFAFANRWMPAEVFGIALIYGAVVLVLYLLGKPMLIVSLLLIVAAGSFLIGYLVACGIAVSHVLAVCLVPKAGYFSNRGFKLKVSLICITVVLLIASFWTPCRLQMIFEARQQFPVTDLSQRMAYESQAEEKKR